MQEQSEMDCFCEALLKDLYIARAMIQEGFDINMCLYYETPLRWAVRQNSVCAVRFLIEGVNLNLSVHGADFSPLYDAVVAFDETEENYDILQLLLENGASVNEKDARGSTVFLHALTSANLEPIKFLLYHGADITVVDNLQQTALHYAAHNSRPDVIQFILDKGCDTERADEAGFTALHTAALFEKFEACEFLFSMDANVNKRTKSGQTPLTLAVTVYCVSGELVRLLLELGANVADKFMGHSVLQMSVL